MAFNFQVGFAKKWRQILSLLAASKDSVSKDDTMSSYLFRNYVPISLCLKWTREVRKNGRSKICPFLYSNGHTEAKKIPENFFHWYHFLCYKKICLNFSKCFSGHFAKKFFLAVTNFWTFLMSFRQKKFFANFHLKKSC